MFRHLTLLGKVTAVYYRLRRIGIVPAVPDERCIMGSPVGDGEIVHCPRPAKGRLFCWWHERWTWWT